MLRRLLIRSQRSNSPVRAVLNILLSLSLMAVHFEHRMCTLDVDFILNVNHTSSVISFPVLLPPFQSTYCPLGDR